MNNRKLIQGFYRGSGIPDVTAAIRQIDKLDKLAAGGRRRAPRRATPAPPPSRPERCLELATIRVSDHTLVNRVQALGVSDELSAGASPSSRRCSRAAPTSCARGTAA